MKIQRRQFIKSAVVLGGGLLASRSLTVRAFPPTPNVRREVNSPAALADLANYKKAVAVMKLRQNEDPTSWEFQANIHYNWCPHGNWFFLPWHRAYLLHFEQICRAACGDPTFNLPYWDWTKNPKLPVAFWGEGNTLMDSTRENQPADKIPEEFTGTSVMNVILGLDSFEDFGSYRASVQRPGNTVYGRLEGNPHNYVHGFIGGNMGNFLSPRDPIFWLHHANVDRIWATWNDKAHLNPTDTMYTNYVFKKNFYQVNGQVIPSIRSGDMSDQRSLGYIYDSQLGNLVAINKRLSNFKLLVNNKISSLNQRTELEAFVPASFQVKGINGFADIASQESALIPANRPGKKEVKAIISDIVPPEKEDFFVRVFLDCPYLSKDTPISDNHYVGSFAFFGSHHLMAATSEHMAMPHRLSYVFDITNNLMRLKSVNQINDDQVKIQLLAVPYNGGSKARLITGKVDIVVAQKSN